MRHLWFIQLIVLAPVLTFTSIVLAAEPGIIDVPVTGHANVDSAIKFIGAIYVILSVLAAVLPKAWTFTQVLARFTADLRGVLTKPEPPKEPKP